MSSGENPGLCCCEYFDENGSRTHVLAILCDCQEIDEAVERFITCKPLTQGTLSRICSVIYNRCRIPWCDGRGARRIEMSVILPVFLVPATLILASQGWYWTLTTFFCLPFVIVLLYMKLFKHQFRTQFFLSWSISSLVFLLGIFQFEVVPYLEILFSENLVLMCFIIIFCICGYLARLNPGIPEKTIQNSRESLLKLDGSTNIIISEPLKCRICDIIQPERCSHCRICDHCVLRRDHHCLWLDTCIGAKNHRLFIVGLTALFAASLYGSLLTLTTICHPVLIFETFLLPDNCSDVYDDAYISITYVSALYALIIAFFALMLLLQQLYLICQNATVQEFRHKRGGIYSKGSISMAARQVTWKATFCSV